MKRMRSTLAGLVVLAASAVSADDGLLAFYPFKDGATGTSAADVALVNSVTSSSLGGTVTLCSTDQSAAAVFDGDAPGVRIYSSHLADAELLCVAPRSIDIASGVEGSSSKRGASIVFAGAGTELSKHHDTGFTVEYFFKMESEDSWNAHGATTRLEIYKDVSPFFLYLPCENAGTVRCGIGGSSNEKTMFAINRNLPAVNDGKWHHVAIVQRSDGYLEVYLDRVRYILVAAPESLKREEVAAGSVVKLGCDALTGKISCVRMTAKALTKDEFMYVSSREQIVNDEGVLAFYPFDDGDSDSSATGTNKVRDAVHPGHCPGHVVAAKDGSPSLTWDSDRPGKYIYAGKCARKPIYVDPGSLHMTSDAKGSSGTVRFYGLAKDLNACRDAGHTVEYFLKLDDSDFGEYTVSFWYAAGYFYDGEDGVKGFHLYLPFAMYYSNGRQFRYSIGTYNGGHATNRNLPFDMWDGNWHHVAVVQSNEKIAGEEGETTNRFVKVYVDGVDYNSIQFDGILEGAGGGDLELGNFAHHGRYSCLKITGRALSPDEFMCATDRERTGLTVIVR